MNATIRLHHYFCVADINAIKSYIIVITNADLILICLQHFGQHTYLKIKLANIKIMLNYGGRWPYAVLIITQC